AATGPVERSKAAEARLCPHQPSDSRPHSTPWTARRTPKDSTTWIRPPASTTGMAAGGARLLGNPSRVIDVQAEVDPLGWSSRRKEAPGPFENADATTGRRRRSSASPAGPRAVREDAELATCRQRHRGPVGSARPS